MNQSFPVVASLCLHKSNQGLDQRVVGIQQHVVLSHYHCSADKKQSVFLSRGEVLHLRGGSSLQFKEGLQLHKKHESLWSNFFACFCRTVVLTDAHQWFMFLCVFEERKGK